MLDHLVFLIVKADRLDDHHVGKLVITIENNNGVALVKNDYDNARNWLVTDRVTNVVSNTVDFIEFDAARAAMVPVTTPQWVYDSVNSSRLMNPKQYSPDRRLFLKNCFVCISDEIPVTDKEVIYGGVRAFGGQYLDDLTKYTTHLITTNLQNDKSLIALSADIDIKLVTPNWIDECFKMGQKLDEAPYYLEGAVPTQNSIVVDDSAVPDIDFDRDFFKGKKCYVCSDYNLGESLRQSINALIEKSGGCVVSRFDKSIDVYIGKYRQGKEFSKSFRSNRIIIANLQWLYTVVVDKKWVLPTNSQLLHYPIPFKPLPEFQSLKISITNYSGDARYYLSKLITILGGTFTKTLTKENDYLIVAGTTGKKFETATKKWLKNGKPFIKLVNHLWLEECYAKWELLDDNQPKYKNFTGAENLLGRTKLDKDVLKNWNESDVDDSMNEDAGLLRATQGEQTDYSEDEDVVTNGQLSPKNTEAPAPVEINQLEEKRPDNSHSASPQAMAAPEQHARLSQEKTTLSQGRPTPETPNTSSPAPVDNAETRPKGRSAKAKATAKLHQDMDDLNQYLEMSKSSKKMKEFLKTLDGQVSAEGTLKRSLTPEIEGPKKQAKAAVIYTVLMTGCEAHVNLSKQDLMTLRRSGIKVANDAGSNVNVLVAPKVLRTEKFLTSLATVDKIIHPQYLLDLLSDKDVNIDDYSLDKFEELKALNLELGYSASQPDSFKRLISSENKGSLFQDWAINLSSNLNGGYSTLSKILKFHGAEELYEVTFRTALNLKKLVEDQDTIIIVVHATKDAELIAYVKKKCPDDVTMVDWDWCVKSIFKMEVQRLEDYVV